MKNLADVVALYGNVTTEDAIEDSSRRCVPVEREPGRILSFLER